MHAADRGPRRRGRLPLLLLLVAVAPWLEGCSRGKPPPVPLSGDEACAACRMAVSQPRFAAQIAAPGGRVEFFDDLGCLLRRLPDAPVPEGAAVYVSDFGTGRWIDAQGASYLHAPRVHTPMGSGLVAFATREAASAAAQRHGGRLLGWSELPRAHAAAKKGHGSGGH